MNLELFLLLQLTENVLSENNKYFGFKTKNFKRKDIFSKNNYVLETHILFCFKLIQNCFIFHSAVKAPPPPTWAPLESDQYYFPSYE